MVSSPYVLGPPKKRSSLDSIINASDTSKPLFPVSPTLSTDWKNITQENLAVKYRYLPSLGIYEMTLTENTEDVNRTLTLINGNSHLYIERKGQQETTRRSPTQEDTSHFMDLFIDFLCDNNLENYLTKIN